MSITSKFRYYEENENFVLGFKQSMIFTKRGFKKQWRWYLYSKGNWQLIAMQNETIFNLKDCLHNAKLTRSGLNDLLDTYLV